MDNTRETFGYLWKQVAEVCLKVFSSDPSPMLGRGREPPPSSKMQRSKRRQQTLGNLELRQVRRQRRRRKEKNARITEN